MSASKRPGLVLAVLVSVAALLGALGVVSAAATPPPAVHHHFGGGGGGGKFGRLYAPQAHVKLGKAVASAAYGRVISGRASANAGRCGPPQLCNNGGPVQVKPRVYLVFWGKWWWCTGRGCVNCPTSKTGCGDPNSLNVENYLSDYWSQVGRIGDNHALVMSQYYAGGDHPTFGAPTLGTNCSTDGNNNCGGVVWQQDPPAAPTAEQLATMAQTAADYFGLASNTDAQIVILTPHGSRPFLNNHSQFPSWCAYHNDEQLHIFSSKIVYTVMPWLPDANSGTRTPCHASVPTGIRSNLRGWSEVGGHEFAESVTDPVPTSGYHTPLVSDSGNTEIGDRCNFNGVFAQTMADGRQYWQQQLWSNLDSSCVQSVTPKTIRTFNGGKCVDNAGTRSQNGNKIELWNCNGTGAQRITYQPSSGHLVVNGGCLDVSGGSHANGTKVIWYHCGSGPNDKWEYDAGAQEWQVYRGVLGVGAKCLDDPAFTTSNGRQLQIYDCNGASNQQWTQPVG